MTRETLAIWSGCIAAAGLFLLYTWLVVFRVRPTARTEVFDTSDGGSIPSPGTNNMATSWTEEQLIEAVKTSKSLTEILGKLYKGIACNNYGTVRKHIARLNLDTTHFRINPVDRTTQNYFSKGLKSKSTDLRKKLKEVLAYECEVCKNPGKHLGRDLTLQVDHIDGDNTNNLRENLRWLCPNCHTQTATYGRIKNPKPKKPPKSYNDKMDVVCATCNKTYRKHIRTFRRQTALGRSKFYCSKWCHPSSRNISDEEMLRALREHGSYLKASKALGISDKGLKKRIIAAEKLKNTKV